MRRRGVGSKMKFNKAEIALLANQPSHKFDKEGVLFVREKQEGFFKKNEGKQELVICWIIFFPFLYFFLYSCFVLVLFNVMFCFLIKRR